jgi:hypothetical protein
MKPSEISIADLLEMLEVDYRTLKTLLRRNGLPTVPREKPVQRRRAEEIYLRLRGKDIDWVSYAEARRPLAHFNALDRKPLPDLENLLELAWKRVLQINSGVETEPNGMLGFAVAGGFLAGSSEREFVYANAPGLNMVIGDRGSGKSTVLKWFASLSGCMPHARHGDLIASVLSSPVLDARELSERLEAVGTEMTDRGVEHLVWIYKHGASILALGVVPNNGYCLLERADSGWIESSIEVEPSLPKIRLLRQGDVFRIADVADRYAFNRIFDGLNAELAEARQQLSRDIVGLKRQLAAIQDEDASNPIRRHRYSRSDVSFFFRRASRELREARTGYSQTGDRAAFYRAISASVNRYDLVQLSEPEYDLLDVPSADLSLHALWLLPSRRWILGWLDRYRFLISESEDDASLQPIEDETDLKAPVSRLLEAAEAAEMLIDVTDRVPLFDPALEGLVERYNQVSARRARLRQLQLDACRSANKSLRDKMPAVRFVSEIDPEAIGTTGNNDEVLGAPKLRGLFEQIQRMNLAMPRRINIATVDRYRSYVENVLRKCAGLGFADAAVSYSQLCDPISAELMQGNRATPFQHQSFGQRSAMVLALVLRNPMPIPLFLISRKTIWIRLGSYRFLRLCLRP